MVAIVETPSESARREMVETQMQARGVKSRKVLDAFMKVPREIFVPPPLRSEAYKDTPLPTMLGQTISQPFISACMTELLQLPDTESCKVLEVGAGTGYVAAILACMGHRVVALDIFKELVECARHNLSATPWQGRVKVFHGDGTLGFPPEAPFDAIILSGAVPAMPPPLVMQLKPGGRMSLPLGDISSQRLVSAFKLPNGTLELREWFGCRFVPMRGAFGFSE